MNRISLTASCLLALLLCLSSCLSDTESGDLLVDENGLLTDLALAVEPDQNIGFVPKAVEDWVAEQAIPVRSTESDDFSDLEASMPAFSNKRVVGLGSSTTGAQEFDLLKVRMIKFLHQNLGYNVVCLPARYFDVWLSIRSLESNGAEESLLSSLSEPVSSAMLDLFEYALLSEKANNPLHLHGVDIAPGINDNDFQRSLHFQQVLLLLGEEEYAAEVYLFDRTFAASDAMPDQSRLNWLDEFGPEFINNYDNLHTFLWNSQEQLLAATGNSDIVDTALRSSWDMAQYLRYLSSDTNHDGARNEDLRNKAMANQIKFLLDEKYPVDKFVIWSSNENVRYLNEQVASANDDKSMMAYIADSFPFETYSMGFYLNRGYLSKEDRSTYQVHSASNNSLESILYHAGWKYSFLDLQSQTSQVGNEWMYEETEARHAGLTNLKLVPNDQYDGLLFVDEVSPAQYIH